MNRVFNLFISIFFTTILLSACTYTATLNRSPYVNQLELQKYTATRPAKKKEDIIYLKKFPDKPHVLLGTLHAPDVEWTAHYTTDDLMDAMSRKAAELGADAIVNFRFEENPVIIKSGRSAVPFKGLHAWGEIIIYAPEETKKKIEP